MSRTTFSDHVPTLTHATERDVDLLLIEELKCSPDFVRWFSDKVAISVQAKINFSQSAVLHSKRRTFNRREIDIHLSLLESNGQTTCILIENKLDTAEQVEQAESYRAEAEILVASNRAQAAYTVVICPTAYANQHHNFVAKFGATISYEEISQYFASRSLQPGELSTRLKHRHEMLEQAISKSRRGYEAIPIMQIGMFNRRYLSVLKEMAPDIVPGRGLKMSADKPSESVSMIFDCDATFAKMPTALRPTRFAHELGRGKTHRANYVNVQFRGFCSGYEKLEPQSKSALKAAGILAEPQIDRRTGNGTLKLMIGSPPVDNQEPFERSEDAIRLGIATANSLRKWCIDNQALLERIASLSK